MLPKKQRLQIQKFRGRSGARSQSGHFSLKRMALGAGEGTILVGVVIGKQHIKKATARNKLRRMIYRFFSEHQRDIARAAYLIYLTKSIGDFDKASVYAEMKILLRI